MKHPITSSSWPMAALLSLSLLALVGCGSGGGDDPAFCGDAVRDVGESCDGSDFGAETCLTRGFSAGTLACTEACLFDVSGCTGTPVECGDGVKAGDEDCDGADFGGTTCTTLGFESGTLSCSETCTIDTSTCAAAPVCGDQIANGTDSCDGADLGEETCVALGYLGGTLVCTSACDFDISGCIGCGNQQRDLNEDFEALPEQCDGPDFGTDTCVSLGYDSGILACTESCRFNASGCATSEPLGESCLAPVVINILPYTITGDSSDAADDHTSDGCLDAADAGAGVPDEVYALTPVVSGRYTLTIDAGSDGINTVLVTTDCFEVGAYCTTFSGDLYQTGGPVDVQLEAGTTYYIILDGLAPYDASGGPYTLTVSDVCQAQCTGKVCGDDGCGGSCGDCGADESCTDVGLCQDDSGIQGQTCGNPFAISAAPSSVTGDSTGVTDNYQSGTCGDAASSGQGVPDQVYEFTPTVTGVYSLSLPDTGTDGINTILVTTDCGDIDAGCIDFSGDLYTTGGPFDVSLEAGTTYYLIVDGLAPFDASGGPYTLEISAPCIPQCSGKACGDDSCGGSCGSCASDQLCSASAACVDASSVAGNTCNLPLGVIGIPFSGTGSTLLAGNTFSTTDGACGAGAAGVGGGSSDQVWSFTPGSSNTYAITVTPSGSYDPAVYVATSCSDVDASCLASADEGFDGTPEKLAVDMTGGTTYFIVVDGWSNAANVAGDYHIEVNTCTPSCGSNTCGSDGCGGSCGDCGVLASCEIGVCVAYGQAQITAATCLNLRDACGTASNVITCLPSGTIVDLTGPVKDCVCTGGGCLSNPGPFYPVLYNGSTGWLYGEYLTLL